MRRAEVRRARDSRDRQKNRRFVLLLDGLAHRGQKGRRLVLVHGCVLLPVSCIIKQKERGDPLWYV